MKRVHLFLVFIISIFIVVGCTDSEEEEVSLKSNTDNFNKEGDPIVNDEIQLTMMGPSSPLQTVPWNEMKVFQVMKEKTNIDFEFNNPSAESAEEKLNLAFASNELPDILLGMGLTIEQEAEFGSEGQLIPLEDLIDEYAPNIQKVLEEKPEMLKSITAADGHIYSLPFVDSELGFLSYQKLWINQTWLDNLGLDMPETVDEFYSVLKAFKEEDPNGNGEADEIPMAGSQDANVLSVLLGSFGFTDYLDVTTGSVRFAPIEEEYKAYLTYMNKLYEEGLYDSESFVQDKQQVNAKGANEQLGVFYDGGPFLTVGVDQNEDYVALSPLTSEFQSEKMAARTPLVNTGVFAITSENEYPEATIRWVDYLYSDEGSVLYNFGVEGEDFEYIDDKQGARYLTPEGMERNEFVSKIKPLGVAEPRIHDYIQELSLHKQEETDPQDAHIMQQTLEHIKPFAQPTFPIVHFTEDELQTLKSVRTDIEDYIEQAEAQFITGRTSIESDWDDYLNTLEAMNVEEYIQVNSAAYERWKEVE
ncbi:extracellular solute-binding protein [Gracilibacillus phocaeensis]|uniref:extracellular solute-binding protein n=1 Tax=Gracilibacillus phocaeensis TaxID=2042304 RepID=UPI00102F4A47|nr:extracellular solute-binding protein [Gracilibacillus phocaeensis]